MGFHVDGHVLEMGGGWRNQAYKTSVKASLSCGRIWSCLSFLVYWVLNVNKVRFSQMNTLIFFKLLQDSKELQLLVLVVVSTCTFCITTYYEGQFTWYK